MVVEIGKSVKSKSKEIEICLLSLLASGHILIEDTPGTGKTTLANSLAKILGHSFTRIQFTNDLLPADILGVSVFNPQNQTWTLKKGPLFSDVVLADEINRASPRSQSALLQAMEEKQVSIDGVTYDLSSNFCVIATQNPYGLSGTQALPESQLDRFMCSLTLGFLDFEDEVQLIRNKKTSNDFDKPNFQKEWGYLRELYNKVHIAETCAKYLVDIVRYFRQHENSSSPLSVRASLALSSMAKAKAVFQDREFVIPEDIQFVSAYCLGHRLNLKQGLSYAQKYVSDSIHSAEEKIKIPV